MADKQIVELPTLNKVTDETLIPVYQPGQKDSAQKMSGRQFGDFARESAAADVQRAVDAAKAAEQAKEGAEGAARRSEEIRDTIIIDQERIAKAVEAAEASALAASNSEAAAGDSATLSQSWAGGGTGTRDGEDSNNSRYWAGVAQAEADRATVPAVQGVYNIILQDRSTGEKYALLVENARLKLLGVSNTLEATELTRIDTYTGINYEIVVNNGKLGIEEA